MAVLVLGAGIVGRAAVWDLLRRGHEVVVADADPGAAAATAAEFGAVARTIDAAGETLAADLAGFAAVVSAVPYRLGVAVARAAVAAGAHYVDFGGNPTVVSRQLLLDGDARAAGVAVVPDCGLAPGVANVLAVDAVAQVGLPAREVRLRVGALPREPTGTLRYQLAFNPEGLINEYAEPCLVLSGGEMVEVDPLTGFEAVAWEGWGPLEAFHTAGGSSSLPQRWAGRVTDLDYKTLRYPGHGEVFRAMLELGLFDERAGGGPSPRSVLLEALRRHLPSGAPDVVLVRVWAAGDGGFAGWQIEDLTDGRFSALARTTAFPATALVDLLLRGEVTTTGAVTMDGAVPPRALLGELRSVGIVATPLAGPDGRAGG